jgi:hypothetical protein
MIAQWYICWEHEGSSGAMHPLSFTENQRRAIEHIMLNAGKDPAPPISPEPVLTEAEHAKQATAAKRIIAVQSGYTGDPCNQCHGFRTKRNGSCLVCEDCGTTTGCS